MFILKKGHQPGVYVPLRALFLVICPSQPWDNLSPVSRDTCDNCSHFEASF